ncbi:MAG: transcription elongation factor GreA [Oscillospiraceae bacterium]|nr:transcription elongation factor GreA [Oscillospiraceae bacterium]
MAKFRMSEERYKALKDELNYLQTVREKEVSELIKEARSFGDLSENSEYDEAKTEQGMLYSKIAEIKNLIENAEIIEHSKETGKVGLGTVVTVVDLETKEEEEYHIVSSQEADPLNCRVSEESPFGASLIGHKDGDTITVHAPAGDIKYKIKKISKAK